ncbi:MAG: hypothetical protein QNK37_17375 [Acidobacteriota bacterium]|nr:hypothetical protein [Acidobacteriota bacterium]
MPRSFFVCCLIFAAASAVAQDRHCHLPPPDSAFRVHLLLKNTTDDAASVQFTAYDDTGTQTGETSVTVDPGAIQILTPVEAFPGVAATHLVSRGDGFRVTTVYQSRKEGSGPSYAPAVTTTATAWRLLPGKKAFTWDGIAVVNAGDAVTGVLIEQLDAAGNVVAERRPEALAALNSNGKAVFLLSSAFDEVADSSYRAEPNAFFQQESISHVRVADNTNLVVMPAYANRRGGAPGHIIETSEPALKWTLYPGNWDAVNGGLAVLNMGYAPTTVTVTQRAFDGALIDGPTAVSFGGEAQLMPSQKGLYRLNSGFETTPDSVFEISADQPLLVLGLLFDKPDANFLWRNPAIPE